MKKLDEMMSGGCYGCGALFAGTAHAVVAMAEVTLVGSPHVHRQAVLVCVPCAKEHGFEEKAEADTGADT